MEPTIYKPSIYKGAGIYNTWAGGGGGGGGIQQEFRNFHILGKNYKYVKIDNGLWWPCENIDYIDENINDGFIDYLSTNCCAYYNNDEQNYKYNGRIYNFPAINYITGLVPNYCRRLNASTDVTKILNYIQNKLDVDWTLSNILKTYCAKTNEKNSNLWNNSLALLQMGFEPTGYIAGIPFSFGGISNDAYFGVTAENISTTSANVITFRNSEAITYANGNQSNIAYVLRFMIEE